MKNMEIHLCWPCRAGTFASNCSATSMRATQAKLSWRRWSRSDRSREKNHQMDTAIDFFGWIFWVTKKWRILFPVLDVMMSHPKPGPKECQDMSQRPPPLPIKADFINFMLQQVWEVLLGWCWPTWTRTRTVLVDQPSNAGTLKKHGRHYMTLI